MTYFRLFLCAIVGMTIGALYAISAKADQVSDMLLPSARVEKNGMGSATAIYVDNRMGTYLLTALHVVGTNSGEMKVQFYGDDKKYPAYMHSYDVENDLAVIVTPYKHKYTALLGDDVKMFEPTFCVGGTLGNEIAPSRGIITGKNYPMEGKEIRVTRSDCGVSPGSSGGALFVQRAGRWALSGVISMVGVIGSMVGTTPISFLGFIARPEPIITFLRKNNVGFDTHLETSPH